MSLGIRGAYIHVSQQSNTLQLKLPIQQWQRGYIITLCIGCRCAYHAVLDRKFVANGRVLVKQRNRSGNHS